MYPVSCTDVNMSPDLGNAHSWKTQNQGFPKVLPEVWWGAGSDLVAISGHKIGARGCDSVFDGILTLVYSASVNTTTTLSSTA